MVALNGFHYAGDHHKFSMKTNLHAFNTKRFPSREKPRITTISIFLIGAERALNDSLKMAKEKKKAKTQRYGTTSETVIDLQLMSTTLHCIYILCIAQLPPSHPFNR